MKGMDTVNEEILKLLGLVKDSKISTEEASELLSAMYEDSTNNSEEKQTTVIRNYLPWDDDGKLRIVAFKGHKQMKASEAYNNYKFTVELKGDVNDVKECCGNIDCGTVYGSINCGGGVDCSDVKGNVSCGGGADCGSVGGNVNCGGGINCKDISGNASCGGTFQGGNVGGNAAAGGKMICGDIDGDAKANSIECGRVKGKTVGKEKVTYSYTVSDNGGFDTSYYKSDEFKNNIRESAKYAKEQIRSAGVMIGEVFTELFDGLKGDSKNTAENADSAGSASGQTNEEKIKTAEQKIKDAEERINHIENKIDSCGNCPEIKALPWEDDKTLRIAAFLGRKLLKAENAYRDYNFNINIDSDIDGDIECCGNLTCGDINGDVKSGASITCSDVDGDADAGTSISCGDVGGDVNAGTSVSAVDIDGDVSAGSEIKCGDIGGDASAGGNIIHV